MAKHTITVNLPTRELRGHLEDVILERIADDFGVSSLEVEDVKGQKLAIRTAATKLYPQFEKALLKELSERASDDYIDVVDNMTGFHGAFAPLDRVVDKFTNNPGLSEDLDAIYHKKRVERLKETAEELGYELKEIDE